MLWTLGNGTRGGEKWAGKGSKSSCVSAHTYTHGKYIHICDCYYPDKIKTGGSFKNMFNPAKTYTHPSLQPSNKSSVLLQETFCHQGRQYKRVMTKAENTHSLAQVFSSCHYWYLGPGWVFAEGAVVCIVAGLAASLASRDASSASPCPPILSLDNQKCLCA